MNCKICSSQTNYIFEALVLNKYNVKYYQCTNCNLIQTEEPFWLEEAYNSAISNLDTGILLRNNELSKKLTAILPYISENADKIKMLDYGGGYGILVRLMRDIGFNFYWYDKHCKNLFAKGFEKNEENYSIVTAFEVFEHLVSPLEEINFIFSNIGCDTLIFSTLLYENQVPTQDWWYYSFESGQHIVFYNNNTLEHLAKSLNYYFYSYGDFHIFTKNKLNYFKINYYLIRFNKFYIKNKKKLESKTFSDHLFLKNQFLT
ncbi:MAG: class I SAM-dependent methyltransferase [Spirochaetota bacterium]|nr:class I SAM-dependent methyltransferase [Spirochaetota bacterium]